MSATACPIIVNGQCPGSGGGDGTGIDFLEKIDTSGLTNVEIDLRFEDNLNDSSGNGRNLSVGAINPRYQTHRTGLRGVWGPSNRLWDRPFNDANLTITGPLTIHILANLSNVNSGKLFVFAPFGGGGETEADNWLYSLQLVSGGGSTPLIRYFVETGAGANVQHDFTLLVPEGIGLLSLTRENVGATDDLRFFWNGQQAGVTGTGITRPTGGTNSRLCLGDVSGSPAWACWYYQFLIQSEYTTPADVLAVARQVGVAPPA